MTQHMHAQRSAGTCPEGNGFADGDVAGLAAAMAPDAFRPRGEGAGPRTECPTTRRFGGHVRHTDAYTQSSVRDGLTGKALYSKGMGLPVCAIP